MTAILRLVYLNVAQRLDCEKNCYQNQGKFYQKIQSGFFGVLLGFDGFVKLSIDKDTESDKIIFFIIWKITLQFIKR